MSANTARIPHLPCTITSLQDAPAPAIPGQRFMMTRRASEPPQSAMQSARAAVEIRTGADRRDSIDSEPRLGERVCSARRRRSTGSLVLEIQQGDAIGQRALDLVNDFRMSQGQGPLKWSDRLARVGQRHSDAMLASQVPVGHMGAHERMVHAGAENVGENVASVEGSDDPVQSLVEEWIRSAPDRRNLLGKFTHMGIAFAHDETKWFATQLLARGLRKSPAGR